MKYKDKGQQPPRKLGLQVRWLTHLQSQEDKKNFESYIRNATSIISRLRMIAKQSISDAGHNAQTDYDCPSWAFKQADINGYIRAWQEIVKLTDHIGD